MKPSLLRYSAWISLVMMALVSCRSSKIFLSGEKAKEIHESFISGAFEKVTYKAKVIYQQRELTGRMLIKNTGDGNYKIAFFNELGMTYLEGTLEKSLKHKKLTIKNIVPVLNHKPFIKSFEKSLQTVFSDKTNPRSSAPPFPGKENTLKIQLGNGFILELWLK